MFDLVSPVGPLNNGYGVMPRESASGGGGAVTHSLSMQVQYLTTVGGSVIRFYDQDFVTGTITVLGQIPLAVRLGADQIVLELSNEDTKSTSFEGSYAFGSNGVFSAGETFAVADAMFTTSDFVRAQIQVYSAVPEPSAWALCGVALVGLGALRRRQAPA